jgi:hypothetical protein
VKLRTWQRVTLTPTWQLCSVLCFVVGVVMIRLVQMNRFASAHGGHNLQLLFTPGIFFAVLGLTASVTSLPFHFMRAVEQHSLRT